MYHKSIHVPTMQICATARNYLEYTSIYTTIIKSDGKNYVQFSTEFWSPWALKKRCNKYIFLPLCYGIPKASATTIGPFSLKI